jgi:hypothetical protein
VFVLLARRQAATKGQDSVGAARFQRSALRIIISGTSSQNAKKSRIKILRFFADCAAKKWPFGQSARRAVCEKAALSYQRSAIS